MIETGSYEVFSELNDDDVNNEDGTFNCGSKCVDYALGSEGLLNIVKDVELIEYNEIVDYDHRGYLTDLNLEVNFEEEFNIEKGTEHRSLNLHKRNHRKMFG